MDVPRIRLAAATEVDRIVEIAVSAGVFTTEESGFLVEVINGHFDGSLEGHQWLVAESAVGQVIAAAQYAPEPFADRMWNLYFIAVDPAFQRAGVGRTVMRHVEDDLRARGESQARTLIVDTSATDHYAGARRFYAGLGYDEEATIRDFYGPGDDKVVYWKSLT